MKWLFCSVFGAQVTAYSDFVLNLKFILQFLFNNHIFTDLFDSSYQYSQNKQNLAKVTKFSHKIESSASILLILNLSFHYLLYNNDKYFIL